MTKKFHIESIQGETYDQFETRFRYTWNEILANLPSQERIFVVKIDLCDAVGCYSKSGIHVFGSFIDANELLNTTMYSANAAEVYEIDIERLSYTNIFSKCYDAKTYHRLAGIDADPIDGLAWVRIIYDLEEVNVYIC